MKLISMTDFVIQQWDNDIYTDDFAETVNNYARFITKPLSLGMFVPCDEDGEILYPQYVGGKEVIYDKYVQDDMMDKVKEYQQAKDKVLFEGFGIENEKFFDASFYGVVRNKDTYVFVKDKEWEKVNDYNTIEDLVLYKLPLTPNAIKQLKL